MTLHTLRTDIPTVPYVPYGGKACKDVRYTNIGTLPIRRAFAERSRQSREGSRAAGGDRMATGEREAGTGCRNEFLHGQVWKFGF